MALSLNLHWSMVLELCTVLFVVDGASYSEIWLFQSRLFSGNETALDCSKAKKECNYRLFQGQSRAGTKMYQDNSQPENHHSCIDCSKANHHQ